MADFAVRLNAERMGLDWSGQEQLAYELNVTTVSISAWENGREGAGSCGPGEADDSQ